MTPGSALLLYLSRAQLARNRKFKDLHKGQGCYIFGNGVSLKTMDLGKFSDKIAIGCNSLFVHSDFDKLDCRYYQIPAPLIYYPYRRYYGRLQRNYIAPLYRNRIRACRRVNFFTSLSNYPNLRGENIYYNHHFGCKRWDLDKCEMDGIFSFMAGGMLAMLGTAIYMGFESAVLVGCDYTFTPVQSSHFFEKGMGSAGSDTEVDSGNASLYEQIQRRLDLTTIVQHGMKSKLLKYVDYEEHAESASRYRENAEIVDQESLDYLHRQGHYNIY